MSAPPITRPSLILRLRDRGNHVAWSEFLQIYEPVIYRVAKGRGLQDADAREIVQEVLLRVASAIDRFDPARSGSFRGWLSQTTRRVAVDRFRQLAVRESAVGGEQNVVAGAVDRQNCPLESEFDLEHRRQLFHRAAESVRPIVAPLSWSAFWHTSVENVPVRQVAQRLGISEGAVYVARCRVLKRIRDYIEEREAE